MYKTKEFSFRSLRADINRRNLVMLTNNQDKLRYRVTITGRRGLHHAAAVLLSLRTHTARAPVAV